MSSSTGLDEKFRAAVKAIQRLPGDGTFQPSNELKLTFYGLYKQATAGPCQDARPSVFNYVNRAKWDAWNRYRSLSKEAAMSAYIDEIRNILETMPQTNEVLEFTQMIGPFYEFVDDRKQINGVVKKKSHSTSSSKNKRNSLEHLVNGTGEHNHVEQSPLYQHRPIPTQQLTNGNGPLPSSGPSSSSSSTSPLSSDVDEVYDDPSDRLIFNHTIASDQIQSSINDTHNSQSSNIPAEHSPVDATVHFPRVYGGENEPNLPVQRSTRENQNTNQCHNSTTHSSNRHHGLSNGARYSFSSVASGSGGGGSNGRHPNNNYNKETQRAILTALTKLQRDVNNILERLNRLETSSNFLQQRELSAQRNCSSLSRTLSRWFPLSGLRRRAIAFILLWPFVVFALIRLFLRARIIIRFRQPRL